MSVRALFGVLVLGLVAALPARAVTIEQVTSPAGIHAWLVEDHTSPIISTSIAINGGASLDPEGKAGLANEVADLLDEGAGDLDSQAFQGRLNDLAIQLSFEVDHDTFGISLKTLAENRDAAFGLLGMALTKPRFDADAIERVRAQELAGLEQELQSPHAIASRALAALLFPDHPYGKPANGDPDTVKAIRRDDLVAWAAHHMGRDTLVVSVVGDVNAEQLKPLLDAAFGGLPEHADPISVADVAPANGGKVEVIRRPFAQSVASFAEAGIKRNDPDWYAAYTMNYVLGGGGFSSRLMHEVREKRGLAYDTESFLLPRDHTGLIGGGVGTRNDKMADSLAVIRHEWQRMADQGVTDSELANAKKYLNGSFPLQLSSTGALAGLLNQIQREHLGLDYLDRRSALINAVTVADVRRVAKRLLRPDALVTVVVGDPKGM
jgi:zinc protease